MQKRDLSYLVFGILIAAVASCRSGSDNNLIPVEPELVESATPLDPPTIAAPIEEPSRPAPPTAAPSDGAAASDAWRAIGSDRAGLTLALPPGWSNLTGRISPAIDNRLGINLLFAADSERTGLSLLAGKPFTRGATLTGLIVSPPTPAADPATALIELLTAAAPAAVRLTPITPIASANGVAGFVVDVGDGHIGLNVAGAGDLRTRVALFAPPPATAAAEAKWIALLLSASADVWPQYVAAFDRILASAEVFPVQPGQTAQEGHVIVRGDLVGDIVQVEATLERGVSDLWTFATGGGRYASLSLHPQEEHLDLSLTLLGPTRQTITHLTNGFAGATETAADVWLAQPGVYIIQVTAPAAAGRYNLALQLSDQPQYSGGGPIAFGTALQAQLPPNGQQYWVFTGVARQRISLVAAPQATTLDAIVELIGPGGSLLFTLDEGFSGDPEVVSAYELPAAGEYAVVVRSFSAQGGPYTLSLDEGDRPLANFYDAGDLTYGAVNVETLQGQEAHAWFLQGKAGDHLLVRVTPHSASLDLDLWLLDAAVERVAAADAFAAGEPETIELTLSADGQYVILVRDFNGQPGEYEIALGAAPAATPETAGALSYGDAVIGAVRPDTAVAWTFSAEAGDVIDVTAQAADSSGDLVLQLVSPSGPTARQVDDNPAGGDEAIRAYVVPAAGQWRIVLRDFFNGMANYRLTLERAQ